MNKITVIMGIYNCEQTLGEALDSLINQTFSDWVCIMCDDGSTDKTYDIAQEYVNRYPEKFKLIRHDKNLGLNFALNSCLEYVDTEFVARMDGDDISVETRFEKEYEFLMNNQEYDIVSSAMIIFDENGPYKQSQLREEIPQLRDVIVKNCICHAGSMMRTDNLISVGGYSTESQVYRVEDVDLWIRMYFNGSKCFNINEPLYMVRENKDSFERKKYRYRISGVRIRLKAAKQAKLNFIDKLHCLYPLIIGLVPNPIYRFLHKIRK